MLDLTTVHRTQYHASGKLHPGAFLLGSVLLMIVSCLVGLLIAMFYHIAFLIFGLLAILGPFVASLAISILLGKVIFLSHCRNRTVAMSLGIACGAVVFLSSHYFATLNSRYEMTRMNREPDPSVRRLDVSDNNSADNSAKRNFLRGILMACEFAMLVWFPIRIARDAPSRAYDEFSRQWFSRLFLRAVPGSGDQIVAALKREESLVETLNLVQVCESDPRPVEGRPINVKYQKGEQAASSWMILEYQPGPIPNEIREAYLTVIEIGKNGRQHRSVGQLQLRSSELQAAWQLFSPPRA